MDVCEICSKVWIRISSLLNSLITNLTRLGKFIHPYYIVHRTMYVYIITKIHVQHYYLSKTLEFLFWIYVTKLGVANVSI